jgi:hypothetical protein
VNEDPTDAIIGNYYDPGQRRLDRVWRNHERHADLVALQAERDEDGRLTWETVRVLDVEDDFVEVWLRPVDPVDRRGPIRIGAWPGRAEREARLDAQALADEQDDLGG